MVKRARLLLLAGTTVALAACGNILGLKDLEPLEDAGADAAGDGAQEASGDGTADTVAPPGDAADGADAAGMEGGNDAREEDGADGDGGGMDSSSDTSATDTSTADTSTMDSSTMMDTSPPTDTSTQDTSTVMDSSTSCEAGTTNCGGQCFDLSNNQQHCGSCTRDCLQGTCSGSACKPFVMSGTNAVNAFDIVAVGTKLYWVDQSTSLWSCTIASCSTTIGAISSSHTSTTRLTFDGAHTLFFTDYGTGGGPDGSIWAYDLSTSTATKIVASRTTPEGIGADSAYVFWAESSQHQVMRYTRLGMTITPNGTGGGSAPTGVALGGGQLYFTDQVSGDVSSTPEGSWTPTPIASTAMCGGSLCSPWALSVDAKFLYWVDYNTTDGEVWQYDLSAQSLNQLASGEYFPVRVASDPPSVYWTVQGSGANGQLQGCNATSCTPGSLESNLQNPVGLAIDSNAVYFGTTGDHKLRMVVR